MVDYTLVVLGTNPVKKTGNNLPSIIGYGNFDYKKID